MTTTVVMPNGQVGQLYSKAFDLNGDFEITAFDAPPGIAVRRVGRSIVTSGVPTTAVNGYNWRVGIKQCCCNLNQTFRADLTINT